MILQSKDCDNQFFINIHMYETHLRVSLKVFLHSVHAFLFIQEVMELVIHKRGCFLTPWSAVSF
jgi:hypothetical protein